MINCRSLKQDVRKCEYLWMLESLTACTRAKVRSRFAQETANNMTSLRDNAPDAAPCNSHGPGSETNGYS